MIFFNHFGEKNIKFWLHGYNQSIYKMAKETKKQVKAQVINEVQRSYQRKIESYDERIKRLSELYQKEQERNRELRMKCSELEESNTALTEKVSQYEEWVERMQDFCNLPENERQKAFATYLDGIKSKTEANEAISNLERMYSAFTSLLFN
jgi:Mg2+ and Co2+ transporter CorA